MTIGAGAQGGATTQKIDLDDFQTLLRGHMGLLIGPATLSETAKPFSDLAQVLASGLSVPVRDTYLEVGDEAIKCGTDPAAIRSAVGAIVRTQKPTALVDTLARARWLAVLSGCIDANFDERFRQATSKRATSHPAVVLNDLMSAPTPRAVPVYKLLATTNSDLLAFSSSTYRLRRSSWRRAVRAFADRVKGAPVMCLGMEDCPWLFADLFAELVAERITTPSAMVFLAADPLVGDPRVIELLQNRTKLVVVDASASQIIAAIESAQNSAFTRPLPFGEDRPQLVRELAPFVDVVAVVNEQLESTMRASERNRLLDILFAPTIPRWDPFVHNMDFLRTMGDTLRDELIQHIKSADAPNTACVVTGSAATGKTTVLKRVAWELAKSGELVVWFKPWFYQDARSILHDFFKTISRQKTLAGRRVFAFLDDPLTLGGLTPHEVTIAAKASGTAIVLVTSARASDWLTREHADFVGSLPVAIERRIDDVLDGDEWGRLPEYLVALGIDANTDEARVRIGSVHTRTARDSLSMLYWLLPQTRNSIVRSVKDEYFRLGDQAGLTKVLIGEVTQSSKILRQAYEMIAVSEAFRAPVPMEVLVSALGVDYGDWQESITSSGAAWGLLYDEKSDDAQSVVYRTRNSVVTDIIVRLLNGGATGRTGEARVMSELLSACNGTAPAYREFTVSVLVPAHRLNDFSYEEGLLLFDAAINALPFEDRTLLHHKGLWIKNKGADPIAACQVLSDALAARVYPYATRGEADEHIHTSIAATVVDSLDRRLIQPEDAKVLILQHLAKARSRTFLNASAVHVQAGLIIRLVEKIDQSQTADLFYLVNSAVAEVERTLLLLDNSYTARKFVAKDIGMLTDIRGKLLDRVRDLGELERDAEVLWRDFRRQDGFVLMARALYRVASEKGKGTDFNVAFTYCKDKVRRIETEGEKPSPGLYEIALYIYYHWRIRRGVHSSGAERIDWQLVADYSAQALRAAEANDDPFHKYVHAIALAHLGKWNEAHGLFGSLRAASISRDLLWTPRDFLMNESGGMRSIQGVMTQAGDRQYLQSADLQTDLVVSRDERWPREGEIVPVAYVRFAFGGATAALTP